MRDPVDRAQVAGAGSLARSRATVPFQRIDGFARSRWALALVAAWSFAEAIVLPVVPDVVLGLLVLVVPRRVLSLFLAAVAGSLAGTAVLWSMTQSDPAAVRAMLLALPAIDAAMLGDASTAVSDGAPWSIASLGFGAPLKVYTWAWATGPATPLALVAGVVLNRILRVGPFVLACTAIGLVAPRWLRRHDRLVLGGYGVAWLAVYLVYWA